MSVVPETWSVRVCSPWSVHVCVMPEDLEYWGGVEFVVAAMASWGISTHLVSSV